MLREQRTDPLKRKLYIKLLVKVLETEEVYVDMSAITSSYLNSLFSVFLRYTHSFISIEIVIVLPFTTIISNCATLYLVIYVFYFIFAFSLFTSLSPRLLNLELCTYL